MIIVTEKSSHRELCRIVIRNALIHNVCTDNQPLGV